MRVAPTVLAFVVYLATGIGTPARAASTIRAAEPIAFVTPDRLQVAVPHLKLTASEANQLAEAWLAQLDPSDPRLAAGAIDLLADAPEEVVESIARKLSGSDRLVRVLAQSNSEVRERIRNARAMSSAKLLDFSPAAFVRELDAALTSGDSAAVASATSTASGFRRLPAEVVTKIGVALDAGQLGDQQRRELVALLRNHPLDLEPIQPRLQSWRANPAVDPITVQKRDLALSASLATRAPMSEDEALEALKSSDLAVSRAAIGYLRGTGGVPLSTTLSPALSSHVVSLLEAAAQIGDWSDAFELLRARAPGVLNNLYRNTPPETIVRMWPAELAAEWVKRAPASVRGSSIVRFSPSLFDPTAGPHADCNVLRYKLGLLTARSLEGRSTLRDFWVTVTDKTHGCRESLDAEIDVYLAEVGKKIDVGVELSLLSRQLGLGSLPEWRPRSAQMSIALAGELTRKLLMHDWVVAKQMMLSGVRPLPDTLHQRGFWMNVKPAEPGLGPEWFFRIVQAAGDAPTSVLKLAAQAVLDESLDPVSRATALIALASTGQTSAQQDVFHRAFYDGNELVSRTALLLLARAYDEGLPAPAFKDLGRDLSSMLKRRELAADAANFLPRLVRFGPRYALLQAEEASWADHPSASCFSLALARPLGVDVGISILDAVTTDDEPQRACIGLLFDDSSPLAFIARQWEANSIDAPERLLGAIKVLWMTPEFKSAGDPFKKRLVSLATAAAQGLPYTLESQALLTWWSDELAMELPAVASQIQSERRKRWVVGALLAVPAAFLLHLAVWSVLLVGYPRSPTLQSVIFWNPFVRKVIGFGYIDLVLLYVPLARRRLFAPFAPEFLRDVRDVQQPGSPEHGYFAGSAVQHWPARSAVVSLQVQVPILPITAALAAHRGRVLLLGKSGLGKSSFLKFWLSRRAIEGRDIMVYLRADQCREGVEKEILKRMKSVGSDQNLLRSMLYAGRLSVYIDGYNEVDLTTQDAITAFVGDYPHGNILVTSQIPLRGFTGIETFELMPLDRVQVREFLSSRRGVLSADAVVRDDLFERAAGAFLDDVWTKPATDEEVQAFEEILANPMDLTSVALLLSQGRVPDLFALERQQFDAVRRCLQAQGLEFRTLGFSRSLLTQRLSDQEDLGGLPFKPEVTELVHAKLAQVRTFAEPSGKSSAQEIRFRHDRIKDFFTHFSLLEMSPEDQAEHAKDARFAGVFPYLARSMPQESAEVLREQLITLAAHIEDHRVSDSFVREYSWRQRFAARDPNWLLSHDLPAAKDADNQYADLARQRHDLEATMSQLRDRIESARRMTRVLATSDSGEMMALAREMLMALGASDAGAQEPIGVTLTTPDGQDFLLAALVQRERIRPFHVDLLLARIARSDLPKLIVLNSQVDVTPEERSETMSVEYRASLSARRALTVSSLELYEAFSSALEGIGKEAFWMRMTKSWAACPEPHEAPPEEIS